MCNEMMADAVTNMTMKDVKVVAFDCDGVLFDTESMPIGHITAKFFNISVNRR
jgi:FMN phosphatase YigB (HAD superfamily)